MTVAGGKGVPNAAPAGFEGEGGIPQMSPFLMPPVASGGDSLEAFLNRPLEDFAGVCACVYARVYACSRVRVRMRACVCVCARARA